MTAVTTRKSATRSLVVAGLLAATAFTVGACGAGHISQTADQIGAVNGNQADIGQLSLRNVRVDYPRDPSANATLANNLKGGRAILLFSIINNSPSTPDTLTSISTDVGTVQITRPQGADTTAVLPQQALVAGHAPSESPVPATAADTATNPPIYVEIDNLTRDLTPGVPVDVTFDFQHNGRLEMHVPVDAANAPRFVSPQSPGDQAGTGAQAGN